MRYSRFFRGRAESMHPGRKNQWRAFGRAKWNWLGKPIEWNATHEPQATVVERSEDGEAAPERHDARSHSCGMDNKSGGMKVLITDQTSHSSSCRELEWFVITVWLRQLFRPSDITELRAIANNGRTQGGYFDFDSLDEMAKQALFLCDSNQFKGIYFTFNPVLPAQPTSQRNQLFNKYSRAKDSDVICRRRLLIDVDPRRPNGFSATDSEKAKAMEKGRSIQQFLRDLNWPDPVMADSGNGMHLLYSIDLPRDDSGLIKDVLSALARRFDDDEVQVDQKVFNPSRITKLYGTVARKGKNLPDRPHRLSRIISIPPNQESVPRELLVSLRQTVPQRVAASANEDALVDEPQKIQLARARLQQIPGAIEGNDGDKHTYYVACLLVIDFDLSVEQALPLIREWNSKCRPPWKDKDLRRKIEYANKKVGPRGRELKKLLQTEESSSMSQDDLASTPVFPCAVPDFFQWDREQARPAQITQGKDVLGRSSRRVSLNQEWILDIVRFEVVMQCATQVLIPDVFLRALMWGPTKWPRNWRQIIARSLWGCAPRLIPYWLNDDQSVEQASMSTWVKGDSVCCRACPLYGRQLRHRHFRLTLDENELGAMTAFISEKIDDTCIEFNFRNKKWTKEEVSVRKKYLKELIAQRKGVLEEFGGNPNFDEVGCLEDIANFSRELRIIRAGSHRVKDVLAHYLPTRIFGPSPLSGLTPEGCNILKAIPGQITRDHRSQRPDKALVLSIDAQRDTTNLVPIYPDLAGNFVAFNGNRSRNYRRHGYGFRVNTWMKNAGYSPTDSIREFLGDLGTVAAAFGLVITGWNLRHQEWRLLEDMKGMTRSGAGSAWLETCVLRIYTREDYLLRWRQYFADRLGFAMIPDSAGSYRKPKQSPGKPSVRSAAELQLWMRIHGVTDKHLADSLGVSRTAVTQYRNGSRPWSERFEERLNCHLNSPQTL